MTNYSKSRIYKIWCDIEGIDEFYIGSTVDFKDRCRRHLNCYNSNNPKKSNLKVYEYIRNNGGFENFYIHVIKKVSCNNDTELRMIEQKYIDELKPTLNCRDAYITEEQKKTKKQLYNQKCKDKITIQVHENYLKRKVKMLQPTQCDHCDKIYKLCNKSQHLKSKYCQNYIKVIN
jgi:hypothetical protein